MVLIPFRLLTSNAAVTSLVESNPFASETRLFMKLVLVALTGVSLPTDQMITLQRLRSRVIISVNCCFALPYTSALSKLMVQYTGISDHSNMPTESAIRVMLSSWG